jgi:phosphatidylglycerophosphate synthase
MNIVQRYRFLTIGHNGKLYRARSFLIDRFTGRKAHTFLVTNDKLTVANAITVSGLIAVFVRMYLFVTGTHKIWIPVLQILVAASDAFDGLAADKLDKRHTYLGKRIDPFRDRCDVGVTLVNMWWLFGLDILIPMAGIGIFEGIIMLSGLWLHMRKRESVEVHWAGKLRMAVHQTCSFVIIAQVYWFDRLSVEYAIIPLALMAIASGIALLTYGFAHWRKLLR